MKKQMFLSPGVHIYGDRVYFTVENRSREPLFLILKDSSGKKNKDIEIAFDMNNHQGSIYFLDLKYDDVVGYAYQLRIGLRTFTDPYAESVCGTEKWGHHEPLGTFERRSFDWKDDKRPENELSEMILYHVHVRGYTMNRSSGIVHRGTFEGVLEKLSHIKALGINAIELMPCYDFNEVMEAGIPYNTEDAGRKAGREYQRYNYWGFTSGAYMTPKNAYSACGNGISSFCSMVKKLHSEGISVITDFYFDSYIDNRYIIDVLRKWYIDYKVDGFRIVGPRINSAVIAGDPVLADAKFIFDSVPDRYGNFEAINSRNIGVLNSAFMYDHRKFLKSDDDMLSTFAHQQLSCPPDYSNINCMADYCGFTLNDLVSYDEKHNEANGEHNSDGNNYNYSWNCGVEGPTRKKYILELRKKQIRNALTFLMLSQGVPEILAGDEFGNSQKGNNNAYCQDNAISWLDWNDLKKNHDIFDFLKDLVAFRKAHPVFHSGTEKRRVDYRSNGAPDVSFHGEQAWAPRFDNFYRHIGIMYNGNYSGAVKEKDNTFYIAYNMHWQNHSFALPNPPHGMVWEQYMSTGSGFENKAVAIQSRNFPVEARSVKILMAVPEKAGSKRPSKTKAEGKKALKKDTKVAKKSKSISRIKREITPLPIGL